MDSLREINRVKKDWRKVDLKIALCYPNIYRIGMSGLTIKFLYNFLNIRDDVLCERFFIPNFESNITSLESNIPLKNFDIIAFTLQYEEDYTNVIKMLVESGINPKREKRKSNDPLVIAGGPCATANPEPMADFIDLFTIGEAEAILYPLIEKIKNIKNPLKKIEEFIDIDGIYISKLSNPVKRNWVRDLNKSFHPLMQQLPLVNNNSPYMTLFGRSFFTEVVRGCNRRCSFCLIRCIAQPKRERELNKIERIINEGIKDTPAKKITLIGAGLSDYSKLEDLCDFIVSNGLEISIPSIRPEAITERLTKLLVKGKQRTISIAPDGFSKRVRKIANKDMMEEDIIESIELLFNNGIKKLKLYYILGLPREKIDDIKEAEFFFKKISNIGFGARNIHININPFIPKPHTKFQSNSFPQISYIKECVKLLKKLMKANKNFKISCLNPRGAQIQALLSIGDRRLGKVILSSSLKGGKIVDWKNSLKEHNISMNNYIIKQDYHKPWDMIKITN